MELEESSGYFLSHFSVSLFVFISYAIVEEMAKLGVTVHTCSDNEAELSGCLKDWKGKGFIVTGSVCDVSSKAQIERLMETTVSSIFNGKLNIPVSCPSSHPCSLIWRHCSSLVFFSFPFYKIFLFDLWLL